MQNIHVRRGLVLLYSALAVLAVWLFINFALPWLLPFIVAFGISRLIEPLVRLLERCRFRRAIASVICTVAAFAVILAIAAVVVTRIIYELTAFAKDLPSLLSELSFLISTLRDKINIYIESAPPELQSSIQGVFDGLANKSADVLTALSGRILGFITSAASFSPRILVFVFTCAISTFFISSGYKEVTAFILRQFPKRYHKAARDFKSDLTGVLGKWVKAEAMLSGITFLQLVAAFLIMRIEFAILLALLVAVIDLMPLLGVGGVLIPWSVVCLIGGDFTRAVTLAVTFGIIAVVRNIVEPKLIGSQIGLPPIATLLAIYIGFCAAGVLGMMLFPIGLIMLKHLNDREYLKLWK